MGTINKLTKSQKSIFITAWVAWLLYLVGGALVIVYYMYAAKHTFTHDGTKYWNSLEDKKGGNTYYYGAIAINLVGWILAIVAAARTANSETPKLRTITILLAIPVANLIGFLWLPFYRGEEYIPEATTLEAEEMEDLF